MAKKINAFWKYLIASFISILGLSSCTCNRGGDNGDVICEYGAPHKVFKLNVTVQDNEGNPVRDALLRLRTYESEDFDNTVVITGRTDENGVLDVDEDLYRGFENDEVYVVYRSSDNPDLNPQYVNDSVKVTPVEVEPAEKSIFIEATYKVDGTLKLKKEEGK